MLKGGKAKNEEGDVNELETIISHGQVRRKVTIPFLCFSTVETVQWGKLMKACDRTKKAGTS